MSRFRDLLIAHKSYWPTSTPAAIKSACVLWYDLKRQGATNESMAANPILKDLSGNGHDMELRNFAWTEGSGISTVNYPGALVSDGVDDYGYVEGLPLLTKEKGLTIVSNRVILGNPNNNPYGALVSNNMRSTDGAFLFEGLWNDTTTIQSFGGVNYNFPFPQSYSYMTSQKYNSRALRVGENPSGNSILSLFAFLINDRFYGNSFALYSLLLFDRDLTDEEIEWVRVNIMKSYTVAELCNQGYGEPTSYGWNLHGDFTSTGVPVPSDLSSCIAGTNGLLKVTNLQADTAFWESFKDALSNTTIVNSNPLSSYFQGTNIQGEVEMTVQGGDYQTVSHLAGGGISKLTLNLTSGFINSMNNAFVWAVSLQDFICNGTYTSNDLTAMFDHCTALTSFTPPNGWNSGATVPAYAVPVSYADSFVQNCPALTQVPQYGEEREGESNILTPRTMNNMLNGSGVTTLGPVLNVQFINPNNSSQCANAFGTKLVDARIKGLNHGDWYLDGATNDNSITHGSLGSLNSESIVYLINNLVDLTNSYTGTNWRTTTNSFRLWTVDSPATIEGEGAVLLPVRCKSGAQAAHIWTSSSATNWKIRVTGLQTGDKLDIGNVGSTPSENAITEDGEYTLSWSGAGYIVNFNDEEVQPTGDVKIEIIEGVYNINNHLVNSANLHIPESWRTLITSELLATANQKGWQLMIDTEVLV